MMLELKFQRANEWQVSSEHTESDGVYEKIFFERANQIAAIEQEEATV